MVYDFERNKIRQQEIEVKALVALMEHGNPFIKAEATKALWDYGFPSKLAEEINNQETFEKICPKCNKWDCGAGAAGGLCVYSTKEEIEEWEKQAGHK